MLIDTLTKASKNQESGSELSEPSFGFLVACPESSAPAYTKPGRAIETSVSSFDFLPTPSENSESSFDFSPTHSETSAPLLLNAKTDAETSDPLPLNAKKDIETSAPLPLNSKTDAETLAGRAVPINRYFLANRHLHTPWAALAIYSPVFIP